MAHAGALQRAMGRTYWADLGLRSLVERHALIWNAWRTAGCGLARPVV